jgi:hypothetical protein
VNGCLIRKGGGGIGNQFFLRTEPLELPREEEDDELERDGAERELEETRADERDGAERELEEIRGEDRETEGEEEPKLLVDEDDLGAEKMDRDEEPEKERSLGVLLRDVVELE